MEKLYILVNATEKGPYEKSQVFAMLRSGELRPETVARWEGENGWFPIHEVLARGGSLSQNTFQIDRPPEQSVSIEAPIVEEECAGSESEVRIFVDSQEEPTLRNPKTIAAVSILGIVVFLCASVFFWFSNIPEPALAQPSAPSGVEPLASTIVEVAEPVGDEIKNREVDHLVSATPSAHPTISPPAKEKTTEPSVQIEEVSQTLTASEQPSLDGEVDESLMENEEVETTMALVDESPNSKETAIVPELGSPSAREFNSRWSVDKQTIDPFRADDLTPEDLLQMLSFRFSSRPIHVRPENDSTRQLKIHKASFKLKTNLTWNPTVEVVYGIPVNPNGSAGSNADQIIMQGFYPGAMEPQKPREVNGKMVQPEPALFGSSYIGSLGCTQFMLRFYTPREIQDDPEECYFYGGKEWVDIVFRAKKEIAKRHKLRNRRLILVGHSIGGTFIQRIAAARPEDVAAAVVLAAPDVSTPTPNTEIAWFLGLNRGDGMRTEYKNLYNELVLQNQNVIFNVFPPDFLGHGVDGRVHYHAEGPSMANARREFLEQIVERNKKAGRNEVYKWPYLRDREKPLVILPNVAKTLKAIPPHRREYLPSREFAECLQSLPVPMQNLSMKDMESGREIRCLVGIPPLGKPQGVVVYLHKPHFTDIAKLIDNVYFLAGKGYVVIAPKLGGRQEQTFRAISQWVKRSAPLSSLSLGYMSWGDTSEVMWENVARNEVPSPSAMATVDFKPKSSLEIKDLPVGGGIKCPLLFVYNEYKVANVSSSDEAKATLKTINSVKEYVQKSNKNGGFARVAIVSEEVTKKSIHAPRAINFSEDFLTKVIQQRTSKLVLPE